MKIEEKKQWKKKINLVFQNSNLNRYFQWSYAAFLRINNCGFLQDSEFPVDAEGTPSLEQAKEHTQPLKYGQYQLSSILKVHDFAVSW